MQQIANTCAKRFALLQLTFGVALTCFGKRLRTSFGDPVGLSPFLSSRLIVMDKHPGVRPIGVEEVVHCILSKAILQVISPDPIDAAGSSQLCASQTGGCAHAVQNLFESPN